MNPEQDSEGLWARLRRAHWFYVDGEPVLVPRSVQP